MVRLNTRTGYLALGDVQVTPVTLNEDLNEYKDKYQLKLLLKNAGYETYSFLNLDGGNTSLSLIFYNNKIKEVSIFPGSNHSFPPFMRTPQEKEFNLKRLASLGIERSYSWWKI